MPFDWLAGGAKKLAQDPRRGGGGEGPARGMAQRQEHAAPQGLSRGVFGGGTLGRGGGLRSLLGGGRPQQEGGPDQDAHKAYGESARVAWGDFLHGPKQEGQQSHGRRYLPHTPADWKQFLGERKAAYDAFRNPKPAAKEAGPAAPAAAEAPPAAPQAIAAGEPAPMAPEPAPVLPEPMAAAPFAPEPLPEPMPLPPGPELVAPGVFEQAPLTPAVQTPEALISDQVDEQELLRRYLAGGMGA